MRCCPKQRQIINLKWITCSANQGIWLTLWFHILIKWNKAQTINNTRYIRIVLKFKSLTTVEINLKSKSIKKKEIPVKDKTWKFWSYNFIRTESHQFTAMIFVARFELDFSKSLLCSSESEPMIISFSHPLNISWFS